MPASHRNVRIVVDEDLPGDLAEHLRARGYLAESMQEPDIRNRIYVRRHGDPGVSISDLEVAQETARSPSVLVTLNLRDYSDPRQREELVERTGISIVQVRVPKAESGAVERPAAIRDVVHRWAHRIVVLHEGEASISTATRRGLRTRTLSAIVEERREREKRNEERRAEIKAARTQRNRDPQRSRTSPVRKRDDDSTKDGNQLF